MLFNRTPSGQAQEVTALLLSRVFRAGKIRGVVFVLVMFYAMGLFVRPGTVLHNMHTALLGKVCRHRVVHRHK